MEGPNEIWDGLEDKMLDLLRHAEKQAERNTLSERVHVAVDPLLLSLRDAVRQGGDYLSSHIRAYEHRILEIQAQIKERNRSFAHVARASSFLEQQVANLKLEQDIWKLLDHLHKCELRHQQPPPPTPSFFSEKEVVQWSNLSDKSLDWDCSVVAWAESLHTPFVNVKGAPSQRMSVEKLRVQTELQRRVESLDPDAQIRGQLEGEQEEEQLLTDLWSLLRGGLLSRAVELCRDYNQHWRAASLGGGEYWYDAGKENQPTGVEGNRRRLLWRTACRELSKAAPSRHERAIYGVLAGDLNLVLQGDTLCQSWDDVPREREREREIKRKRERAKEKKRERDGEKERKAKRKRKREKEKTDKKRDA